MVEQTIIPPPHHPKWFIMIILMLILYIQMDVNWFPSVLYINSYIFFDRMVVECWSLTCSFWVRSWRLIPLNSSKPPIRAAATAPAPKDWHDWALLSKVSLDILPKTYSQNLYQNGSAVASPTGKGSIQLPSTYMRHKMDMGSKEKRAHTHTYHMKKRWVLRCVTKSV